jgi:hypothetical protein
MMADAVEMLTSPRGLHTRAQKWVNVTCAMISSPRRGRCARTAGLGLVMILLKDLVLIHLH